MKLLSVALARSVWLAYPSDINPKGKYLYPSFFAFLLDTYKFKKYPQPGEELDELKGIVFDSGEFKNQGGELLTIKMTIFTFGIIAENRSSTVDTDFFLETLFEQLKEILNIQDYDSIIRGRDYLSQLYVTTDKLLELINPKVKIISEHLEKNLSVNVDAKYQLGSLSFWPDPIKAINPPNFVFERQVTTSFSENRYFSSAPLQTDQHFELLNMLEEILT